MPPANFREDDDLFRIATLGFRGEALPSIGSIAKMAISSRPASSVSGAKLAVDGGKKGEVHAAAAALGTTIEIRDIFYNTPARRKFLKAPATELSHVCDVVNRLALANPQVHFRLQHDGRTVADYVAVKQERDRLQQVLGIDVAKSLKPFSFAQGDMTVSGFLSTAPTSFPNARYLFTFVNRRLRARQGAHPRGAAWLRHAADEGPISGGGVVSGNPLRRSGCQRASGQV